MTIARITLKLFRFELAASAIGLIILAFALWLTSQQVAGIHFEACGSLPQPDDCLQRAKSVDDLAVQIRVLQMMTIGLPMFAAIVLGVGVVGREIERGTASMPWTMGTSRATWLLRRMAVIGAALAIMSTAPAVFGAVLQHARVPLTDPSLSFDSYDSRGSTVVVRALATFAIAVLVGALMGRVLPALLVSLVVVALSCGVVGLGTDRYLSSYATELGPAASASGDLVLDVRYRAPSGFLLTYADAVIELEGTGQFPEDAYPVVRIGWPGRSMNAIELLTNGILILIGAIATVASVLVVSRRSAT